MAGVKFNDMIENRLIFEHLVCAAMHCKRADYSFANADYYDAGLEKHPEMKACIVFGLIALAYDKRYSSYVSDLLGLAKQIDSNPEFTSADLDSALEHVKQLIIEL